VGKFFVVSRVALVIFAVSLIFSIFVPIKAAYNNLENEVENYIIVRPATAADGTWQVVAQRGYCVGDNIFLVGNAPDFWIFKDITSNYLNEYICFGQIALKEDLYGEVIFTFEVNSSQIMYPVRRGNLLKNLLRDDQVFLVDRFIP